MTEMSLYSNKQVVITEVKPDTPFSKVRVSTGHSLGMCVTQQDKWLFDVNK